MSELLSVARMQEAERQEEDARDEYIRNTNENANFDDDAAELSFDGSQQVYDVYGNNCML